MHDLRHRNESPVSSRIDGGRALRAGLGRIDRRVGGCRVRGPHLEHCRLRQVAGAEVRIGESRVVSRVVDRQHDHARANAVGNRTIGLESRWHHHLVEAVLVGINGGQLAEGVVAHADRRAFDRPLLAIGDGVGVGVEIEVILDQAVEETWRRHGLFRVPSFGPGIGIHIREQEEVAVGVLPDRKRDPTLVAHRSIGAVVRTVDGTGRRGIVDVMEVAHARRRQDSRNKRVALIDVDVFLLGDLVVRRRNHLDHIVARRQRSRAAVGIGKKLLGVVGIRDAVLVLVLRKRQRTRRANRNVGGQFVANPGWRGIGERGPSKDAGAWASRCERVAAIEGAVLGLVAKLRHLDAIVGDKGRRGARHHIAVLVAHVAAVSVRGAWMLPGIRDVFVQQLVIGRVGLAVNTKAPEPHEHARYGGFVLLGRFQPGVELVAGRVGKRDADNLARLGGSVVELAPVDDAAMAFEQELIRQQVAAQIAWDLLAIGDRAPRSWIETGVRAKLVVHGLAGEAEAPEADLADQELSERADDLGVLVAAVDVRDGGILDGAVPAADIHIEGPDACVGCALDAAVRIRWARPTVDDRTIVIEENRARQEAEPPEDPQIAHRNGAASRRNNDGIERHDVVERIIPDRELVGAWRQADRESAVRVAANARDHLVGVADVIDGDPRPVDRLAERQLRKGRKLDVVPHPAGDRSAAGRGGRRAREGEEIRRLDRRLHQNLARCAVALGPFLKPGIDAAGTFERAALDPLLRIADGRYDMDVVLAEAEIVDRQIAILIRLAYAGTANRVAIEVDRYLAEDVFDDDLEAPHVGAAFGDRCGLQRRIREAVHRGEVLEHLHHQVGQRQRRLDQRDLQCSDRLRSERRRVWNGYVPVLVHRKGLAPKLVVGRAHGDEILARPCLRRGRRNDVCVASPR